MAQQFQAVRQPAQTQPVAGRTLQRVCACGQHAEGGECAACKRKSTGTLQRAAVGGDAGGAEAPPIVHAVLRSSGQPLDDATRGITEPRFGHDFGGVRIHADGRAAASARAVNAVAYTVGNHVTFDAARYRPDDAVQRMVRPGAEAPEADSTRPASPRFGHDVSRMPLHPPAAGAIPTTLAINEPGDSCEKDADRVAVQVMRMPEPQMRPGSAFGGDSPKWQTESGTQGRQGLQTKPVETGALGLTEAPPSVLDVLRSPGRQLDPATRAFMEPRFGHDFSRIRVHSDAAAERSARGMNARAYTVGQNIAFGCGQFAPGTHEGRQLLAHELAHILQQSDGASARVARQPIDPRHARGFGGEQGMGFIHYRQQDGWILFEGPSGAAGHGVTQSGFDGVAYNTRTGEIHLVDNKSLARQGNVGSATAIDPSRNLGKNLDGLIQRVEAAKDVPGRVRLLGRLRALKASLAAGQPLPQDVKLVVTGVGGQSTGVTGRLKSQGVEFRPEPTPKSQPGATTTAANPPPSVAKPTTAAPPGKAPAAPGPVASVPTLPASGPTPGLGLPKAGGQISEQTRAIAREAAATLKTNQRLLRATAILTAATKVFQIVGDVAFAIESISAAENKLAGKGFKLIKEIEQARATETWAKSLLSEYRPYAEKITAMQFSFFKAAADPRAAAQAYWTVEKLKAPVSEVDYGLSQSLPKLRKALREAEAKENYAKSLLEDPNAVKALAVAGMGSSILVEVFQLSQDWQDIRSALAGALNALEETQRLVNDDRAFLSSWEVSLFRVCEKGNLFGLCVGDAADSE